MEPIKASPARCRPAPAPGVSSVGDRAQVGSRTPAWACRADAAGISGQGLATAAAVRGVQSLQGSRMELEAQVGRDRMAVRMGRVRQGGTWGSREGGSGAVEGEASRFAQGTGGPGQDGAWSGVGGCWGDEVWWGG